jgi:dihydroorotase
MAMKTILKQIQYLDPSSGQEKQGHLVMEKGKILGFTCESITDADKVIEGKDLWAFPGFIDMHVHFREPGGEEKETLETGSRSAAAGGFTTVVCMPNTQPAMDHYSILNDYIERSRQLPCHLLFMGAITRGLGGKELVDFNEYCQPGVVGVTDDGRPVTNARMMLEALQKGKEHGLLVANHCEEESFMFDRSINQGPVAKRLGLTGVSVLAEELMVQRDLHLAKFSNCPVHIQHVSTAGSVGMIRRAKEEGIPVTAESTPHHFSLSEYVVLTRGSLAKMSPPLRTEKDMEAIREGLCDGTLDCIATDHAPHAAADKTDDLLASANGVVGLETAFAAAVTNLMDSGSINLLRLVECLSTRPAEILGLKNKGTLKTGADADVVLVDLRQRWSVSSREFVSKSRNTPFEGMALRGRVKMTFYQNKISFMR